MSLFGLEPSLGHAFGAKVLATLLEVSPLMQNPLPNLRCILSLKRRSKEKEREFLRTIELYRVLTVGLGVQENSEEEMETGETVLRKWW